MRANEFVKKFGLDNAKKVLEVAPIRATSYRTSENNPTGLGGLFGRIDNEYGNIVLLSDLKRLVESWELVEKLGGLNKSKKVAKKSYDSCSSIISDRTTGFECKWVELNKAIQDVESCQ